MSNNITYLVFALKRSGHHGIINWLCSQFDGSLLFKNDCFPIKGDFHSWNDREKLYSNEGDRQATLCNFEDFIPWNFKAYQFKKNFTGKVVCVMVIRDIYNALASRMESGYHDPEVYEFMVLSYIMYLKEALKISNCIDYPLVAINFNKWFSDKGYRQELTYSLSIPFTDKGLNKIMRFGNGSSFDGMSLSNEASKMDVLHRYEKYYHNKGYMKLVSNADSVFLTEKFFNLNPFSL